MGLGPLTLNHESGDGLSGLAQLLRDEQEPPGGRARKQVDPAVRRARRRRGLLITSIVLAVVLATGGGYVGWALTAPVSPAIAASQAPAVAIPSAADIAIPSASASAISISGADDYLGAGASGVWATTGTEEPRPIASISKLITALVILDANPLADTADRGPAITFDKADHDLYDEYYVRGATIAAMPTGTTMSLRDALATMLIPSASNYADALSTWAFGSHWGFVNATRAWLDARGLTGTTIVEPTGLDPRNTSTPGDLLAIGKLAAADPTIAQIAATPSLSLPGPGTVVNTNDLLGQGGVTGLKTGNLGPGTYNLLYTATLDVGAPEPLEVTGVLLGGSSRRSVDLDVLAVLDSIHSGFHDVSLAEEGQQVGTYTTPWGATATMILSDDASIFTWSDTAITVQMDTRAPETYTDGEPLGTVTWTAGPHVATAAIEIEGSIEPPTAWWRITHPAELGG